ncbi:unnamed protein product [Moneuplotes crassus]|uniref:Uncharacterized protein n=1 Tax=Euplotes crassus TaxID=5936 RepID=A0AAD1XNP5_EUPCR|nr:unnamed protein product [Moneuplotes crassus]
MKLFTKRAWSLSLTILILALLLISRMQANEYTKEMLDEEEDDIDDEEYKPVEKQKVYTLTDDNFEEIFNPPETEDGNPGKQYNWLVLFDTGDKYCKIINEELETLVSYINLKDAKIGRAKVEDVPNTLWRLGLPAKQRNLVFFKHNEDKDAYVKTHMYKYHGPNGYNSLRFFIRKGYKKHSSDIQAVPAEMSYYSIKFQQGLHFLYNFQSHFEGAFVRLGYGNYTNFEKKFIIISVILLGGLFFGMIFIFIIKKFLLRESNTDDSDIEQEEAEEIYYRKNK